MHRVYLLPSNIKGDVWILIYTEYLNGIKNSTESGKTLIIFDLKCIDYSWVVIFYEVTECKNQMQCDWYK